MSAEGLPARSGLSSGSKTSRQGKYIYAIIEGEERRDFGPIGVGGAGVFTTHFRDLAAVVSDSEVGECSLSRENLIPHQRVLEKVMKELTLLPVRFGTIAEREEKIEEKVLKARYEEFKELLAELRGKTELGVRAAWVNMEKIFGEIVEENGSIRRLKEKIAKETSLSERRSGMMRVGEMVEKVLEGKKEKEKTEILKVLKPLSVDLKVNEVYGDQNLLNAAFLVKRRKEAEFDQRIATLEKKLAERVRLKYVGPVPPCNFVEVVVEW